MQSPPFPRYLVPPRSKYSPQHHVLKHPQISFLPQCQDQVSHPYKTTGKIIVLYILIFKFLDSNLEDKRFCIEWYAVLNKSVCTVIKLRSLNFPSFQLHPWYIVLLDAFEYPLFAAVTLVTDVFISTAPIWPISAKPDTVDLNENLSSKSKFG